MNDQENLNALAERIVRLHAPPPQMVSPPVKGMAWRIFVLAGITLGAALRWPDIPEAGLLMGGAGVLGFLGIVAAL